MYLKNGYKIKSGTQRCSMCGKVILGYYHEDEDRILCNDCWNKEMEFEYILKIRSKNARLKNND